MRRKLALAGAIVIFALFFLRVPILGSIGGYLVRSEAPVRADVGLVLAGDTRGNRILKGAELVKQGFVPRVLVSGPDGMYGSHECELAIAFAVKAGYPESYFEHFENSARSTRDEAAAAAAVLRKMGVHHVLIVTSDYHTRRAGRLFREALPGVEVTVVAAPDTYFSAGGWWHNREGQKATLYEWLKTVATWVSL